MDFSLSFSLSQTNLLSVVPVPVNQQPAAYSDSATTAYQTPVEIDLITNDIDLDGSIDASSAEVTTPPVNGVVTINASNGVATYTPDDGFSGADSFEYRVADMEGKWSEPVSVDVDVAQLQRNFTYLQEAGGMYYQLSEELAFTDFEWELVIMPENDGDFHQIISGFDCTFNIRATGDVVFFINGGVSIDSVAKLVRGKFNKIIVKRVGNDYHLNVNGTIKEVTISDPLPFLVTKIGGRENYGSNSPLNGIVADLKMWNDGDRTTGTLVVDCPFDDHFSEVTYANNLAATYGSAELWDKDNVYVSEGCEWNPVSGEGRIYSTGAYASLRSYGPTSGNWYKISFELYDLVAGSLVIKIGTDPYGKTFDKEGKYTIIIQAEVGASDSIEFKRYAISKLNDFKLRDISCVKVTGISADTVNITGDESGVYVLNSTATPNVWEGVTDIFGDSYLIAGANPWIDNGDGSFTKPNADGYGQLYLGAIPLGNYTVKFTIDTVENAVGLYRKTAEGSLNLISSYSAPGDYEMTLDTVSTSGNDIWFDSAPNALATISSIVVTENFPEVV